MGVTPSKDISCNTSKNYSYQIAEGFGSNIFITVWPAADFDKYCTNESRAMKEFNRLTTTESTSIFQIGRYESVMNDKGKVVGMTGEFEVIDKYNC